MATGSTSEVPNINIVGSGTNRYTIISYKIDKLFRQQSLASFLKNPFLLNFIILKIFTGLFKITANNYFFTATKFWNFDI